ADTETHSQGGTQRISNPTQRPQSHENPFPVHPRNKTFRRTTRRPTTGARYTKRTPGQEEEKARHPTRTQI
ncbi:hypothetical protein DXG01_017047, partial [Tephrocybe rancida]